MCKLKQFLQRFLQEIMKKKIIPHTSDDGSMSHLSQLTSKPAYYIVDCGISRWVTSDHYCLEGQK